MKLSRMSFSTFLLLPKKNLSLWFSDCKYKPRFMNEQISDKPEFLCDLFLLFGVKPVLWLSLREPNLGVAAVPLLAYKILEN